MTGLMLASTAGHTAVVKRLLAAGADTRLTNMWKRTALIMACTKGNSDVVRLLMEADASGDVDVALQWASYCGHEPCVRLLLQSGADANYSTTRTTPIMLASAAGSDASVKALLEYGADASATDRKGDTPHPAPVHPRRRRPAERGRQTLTTQEPRGYPQTAATAVNG
ncbi:Ankyrin repeat and KH domain-containing protein mask [Diplonema papillatum]|nr:Ankyrin repeat and KH domain-containing protein mask [Diplonema papillatum]